MYAHVVHGRLQKLEITADGSSIEPARATCADRRSTDALDHQIALHVLEREIRSDRIERHIPVHTVDGHVSGIAANLKFRFHRHADIVVRAERIGIGAAGSHPGGDLNAIANLFRISFYVRAPSLPYDHDLLLVPGSYLDSPCGILHGDDRLVVAVAEAPLSRQSQSALPNLPGLSLALQGAAVRCRR